MHIVPAPAESLMKSRVLSIPGLQGVKDETWDGYRLFRLSGGAGRDGGTERAPYPTSRPPFGFTFTDFSQHNMFPRALSARRGEHGS